MKKTLIILSIVVVVLIAAGVFWYVKMKKKQADIKANAENLNEKSVDIDLPNASKGVVAFLNDISKQRKPIDMKPNIAIAKQVRGLGIKI